jgi:hypothetical protein
MNRLPLELDRLYGLPPGPFANARDLRVAVLAVSQPAGWAELSAVWRGVQADLAFPAPAIAVSGHDALQLWFSFAAPTTPTARARLLRSLCARYLADVRATQVHVLVDAADVPVAPGDEVAPQCWSAFVTHDLAAVFAETPWLDIPPSDDGQATILRALTPIAPQALEAALEQLGADTDAAPAEAHTTQRPIAAPARTQAPGADPVHFLSGVVNDESAPLALRIEAARVLLENTRHSR